MDIIKGDGNVYVTVRVTFAEVLIWSNLPLSQIAGNLS